MVRVLFATLLLLVGCHKSKPIELRQTIRINIEKDPQTLDPRKAHDLQSITLVHMFFEGLMRTSKSGELEKAIAERIEVSADGLQYCFHLRDTCWSNGEPLTSFDFAESWRAILDPQFPTQIAYHLYGIKNGQKAKRGEISVAQVGIFTPDAQTLVVDLEYPIPYFLQLVSMSPFFPVPHELTSQNADWSLTPATYVCNGPFKLKTWKPSDRIEGEKNSRYWQAKEVLLSQLDLLMMDSDTEIQMFEKGELDWAGSPLSTIPVDSVESLKSEGALHIAPFLATYFLRVNTSDTIHEKQNPLSSPSFRRALALSMNREAIAEHVLQGGQVPARALTPPKMGLSENGYFQEDKNRAFSLLNDALLQLDLTKEKLEPLRISFSSSPRNAAIVQAIQKQWEEALGIRVELEAIEPKIYFQRLSNREYQLAAGSWIADFDDPTNFLEVFKYKHAGSNHTNWESSRYNDLLNQSALCSDAKERKSILREAEAVLMEQMPILPVFHFTLNYLQRDRLQDVALSPLGKIDFRWAHVETELQ